MALTFQPGLQPPKRHYRRKLLPHQVSLPNRCIPDHLPLVGKADLGTVDSGGMRLVRRLPAAGFPAAIHRRTIHAPDCYAVLLWPRG